MLLHIETPELVAEFMRRAASYRDLAMVKYLYERVLHLAADASSYTLLGGAVQSAIFSGGRDIASYSPGTTTFPSN